MGKTGCNCILLRKPFLTFLGILFLSLKEKEAHFTKLSVTCDKINVSTKIFSSLKIRANAESNNKLKIESLELSNSSCP